MGGIQKYKEQVGNIFSKYSRAKKIAFLVLTLLILSGLIFFISWLKTPDYSILFTNLKSEDASAIIQKLKEKNIDYKLTDGGTTIFVPRNTVYELRLELASEGLPNKGTVGFEIFDKTNFTMTEFTEKMDYQRAIQGELSRTINQFENVEDSRIHITIPEDRLLTEMEKNPTASIVLYMKPGISLTKKQLLGISHLLASSVEGLKIEDISILDNYGNMISNNLNNDNIDVSSELINKYYDLKKTLEKEFQLKINSLLNSIIGQKGFVVQISVEINMDKKEINKETFIPVSGNSGVLRSEQVVEEKYQGGGAMPSGSEEADQNIPSYSGTENKDNKNNYKRLESITNYEVTTETIKQTELPGDIKYISVGVGIDKNLGLSQEDLTGIKDIISSSLGIDQERGDKIKIASIAFTETLSPETSSPLSNREERGILPFKIYYLIPFVVIILALLLLLKKKTIRKTSGETPSMLISEIEPDELTEDSTDIKELKGEEKPVIHFLEERKKSLTQKGYFEYLREVAREKPEDIAVLFRVWLSEDE